MQYSDMWQDCQITFPHTRPCYAKSSCRSVDPKTLHGNVHQVDHVPNGPTNSAAITTMFPSRLCGGKLLVAVTREQRYGPCRLRRRRRLPTGFALYPVSLHRIHSGHSFVQFLGQWRKKQAQIADSGVGTMGTRGTLYHQVQDLYHLYPPSQRCGLCQNFNQILSTRLYKVRTNLYPHLRKRSDAPDS